MRFNSICYVILVRWLIYEKLEQSKYAKKTRSPTNLESRLANPIINRILAERFTYNGNKRDRPLLTMTKVNNGPSYYSVNLESRIRT
jgi:hypothetical protein